MYPHTYTHTDISEAFAQLSLKNFTSNRLREEDNKLSMWLVPQWMHGTSVLRLWESEEGWVHEECEHLFY